MPRETIHAYGTITVHGLEEALRVLVHVEQAHDAMPALVSLRDMWVALMEAHDD